MHEQAAKFRWTLFGNKQFFFIWPFNLLLYFRHPPWWRIFIDNHCIHREAEAQQTHEAIAHLKPFVRNCSKESWTSISIWSFSASASLANHSLIRSNRGLKLSWSCINKYIKNKLKSLSIFLKKNITFTKHYKITRNYWQNAITMMYNKLPLLFLLGVLHEQSCQTIRSRGWKKAKPSDRAVLSSHPKEHAYRTLCGA